jgi:hypothetical protein
MKTANKLTIEDMQNRLNVTIEQLNRLPFADFVSDVIRNKKIMRMFLRRFQGLINRLNKIQDLSK